MNVIFKFPSKAELTVEGTPPEVGEKLIFRTALDSGTYIVERRLFRLTRIGDDTHPCDVYEACINLKIDG